MLRSCSFTFDQLGNYPRAMDFLQLDAGSIWVSGNIVRHYIRDGKLAQAREHRREIQDDGGPSDDRQCLDNRFVRGRGTTSPGKHAPAVLANPDPEPSYMVAPDFLFCGQKESAVRLLKSSIAGHYCAYTGLQNDSVWAKLRGTPEFSELLSEAKKCQSDFLAERAQTAR